VLGVIQLLMILHVVQWLWTGTTITPVEPSESMEAVKHGVITVGAVFFAVALLSTAVLGRWFCGWGCHVVMLQDFCGYLMKRVGIRPRLFRSRLLLWLPLALAVYMFLWPIVYRLAVAPYTRPDLEWPGFTTQFTTSDFWATFPGALMSVPFLLVCGFLTVYLLGAKGYCTYACPYGGFFAPLDELSPLRIRVSDACTQCGHCTAVCTSNVRVHEEVRDYRMVVDQGCMKCLDCVSACPEQALRVGWGTPAFLAKPVVDRPAERRWDLSWNEEIALSAVAVAAFFSVRGALGVPLLFASGIAVCATALAWILWRAIATRDLRLHRWQLKRAGRMTGAGVVASLVAVGSLTAIGAVGSVNALVAAADFDADRVVVSTQVVFSGKGSLAEDATKARAARALERYARAIGFAELLRVDAPIHAQVDARMAWLEAVCGRFADAESRLRAASARNGMSEALAIGIARMMRGAGNAAGASAFARSEWDANPGWGALREELVGFLVADSRHDDALEIARKGVALAPDDYAARKRLAAMLVESVRSDFVAEGMRIFDGLIAERPNEALLLLGRAEGLHRMQRSAEAEVVLRQAIELDPNEWRLYQALGDFLMSIDRQKEAGPFMKKAGDLRVKALRR
jgi:ferredoxin/tetratricopeptide (TPR) repeat protein